MHALEFASLCEATVARVLVARGLYIGCRLCSLDLEYLELIIGPPSGDRDVWDASRGNHALRCAAPAVRRCALGGVLHVSESDHLGVLEL